MKRALPEELSYLNAARPLAARAALAHVQERIVSSPSAEELALMRRIVDEFERRGHDEALMRWLAAATVRERGWVTSLLMLLDGLMSAGKLPASERMQAVIDVQFATPEYCEQNIPARFRHLSPWLKRIESTMCELDLQEMAEALDQDDVDSLARISEGLFLSGEIDAMNAWLDEVDWDKCDEAMRLYLFLGLLDVMGCYPGD